MEWIALLVVFAVAPLFLIFLQLGRLSAEAAREYLRQGAKLIDVRSPEEYQSGHLPNAINIPLGELGQQINRYAPSKEQVLLLHCLSGGRSGMGTRVLKGMGYTKVFNLGSFRRAEKIVGS